MITTKKLQIRMNQKFNILKALGIITVVAGHSGTNFFNWLPVYSFHMPLFIFISGYFFKDKNIVQCVKSKFRTMILPFLLWNLFYGLLVNFFHKYNLIKFGASLNLKTVLWEPFTYGWPFHFNGPAWFVGTLFFVQIAYLIFRKILKEQMFITGGTFLLLHLYAIRLANSGFSSFYFGLGICIERVLFCLIFYFLGHLYSIKLEKIDIFNFNRLILAISVNGIILGTYSRIITSNIHQMIIAPHYFTALIVGITGIYTYLQLAELLKDKVRNRDILSYIGQNTFSIMTHHQFFFWLFNSMLFTLKKYSIMRLTAFNYNKYMENIYYRINSSFPVNDLLYLLIGVFGPLLCCYIWNMRIKSNFSLVSKH